jgi:hypothetical protein
MYIGVDWETVNSIKGCYTVILFPNTCYSSFLMMYYDVLSLTFIPVPAFIPVPTFEQLYCSLVDSRCRAFIHC